MPCKGYLESKYLAHSGPTMSEGEWKEGKGRKGEGRGGQRGGKWGQKDTLLGVMGTRCSVQILSCTLETCMVL